MLLTTTVQHDIHSFILKENDMDNFKWPWITLEPGIYFDLPFDKYCNQKCLNASGLKNILVSPTDFWFRSWMNPMCDEIDEETKAKIEGRAYHKRILEGAEAFYSEYTPAFEYCGDRPCLKTSEEISGALSIRGLKSTFSRKQEGIDRLLAADKSIQIYDVLKKEHEDKNKGKELIDATTVRHIEYAAKMIEFHPELKTYFIGGYPEVTVIWDDPEYEVRFKIRMDYAKVGPVVDLKSFANQMKKNIEKAIDYAVASQKYHIQAGLYLRGREMARDLARQGRIFSNHHIDERWIKAFIETPNDEFWYVFQQKGIAPVARGAMFSMKDDRFKSATEQCLKDATDAFRHSYNIFGEDAWVDITKAKYLHFDQLPIFIGDI